MGTSAWDQVRTRGGSSIKLTTSYDDAVAAGGATPTTMSGLGKNPATNSQLSEP